MQLVAVQFDIQWEKRDANHARVRELLRHNPPHPGDLVALPEMFASGFSMNVAEIAEDEARSTEVFLRATAKEFQIYLIGGLVTRGSNGRGRNEAVVAAPDGSIIARYCKLHPYSPSTENQHYSPGDTLITFDWNGIIVAPFICYDLRFPEIFRAAMRKGAEVMVNIANWPTARVHHWTTLLAARAIENQCYVMGVNRIGSDPNVEYPGRSMIVSPMGQVSADAGDREGTFSAPFDRASVRTYREKLKFLADVRKDFLPRS